MLQNKLNRDLVNDFKSNGLESVFLYTFEIRRRQYFIRYIDPVIDTSLYFKYMNEENVFRFTNIKAYDSIDLARPDLYYFSQFDGVKNLCLGIVNSENELIGTIGYNLTVTSNSSRNINAYDGIYEVVGDLDFRYWGRGIMRYAGLFLVDYARLLGVKKLYAKVLTSNKRAINLLSKFGCSIINVVKQNNNACYLFCLPIL